MDRSLRDGRTTRTDVDREWTGRSNARTGTDRGWTGGSNARTDLDRQGRGRYGGWTRDGRSTTRDFRGGHNRDRHDGYRGDWGGSRYRPNCYGDGRYGRYGWNYGVGRRCGYGWYGGYGRYGVCAAPVVSWYGAAYVPSYFYGYGWGYNYGLGFGLGSSVYVYDPVPYVAPTTVIVEESPVLIQESPAVVEESVEYVPTQPSPVITSPDAAVSDVEQAGALLRQGDDAFQQGRYDEALQLYSQGVLLDDSNGFAHLAYMLPHFVNGQYSTAAESLRRALTLEPMLIDQPLNTRAMYGESSTFDAHLSALRDHVGRSPQDSAALLLLAYLIYGEGDLSSAAAALDDLTAREPGDTLAQVLKDGIARARSGVGISSQPTTR